MLDECDPHYLIAFSEAMNAPPKDLNDLLGRPLFTLAWCYYLLPVKRLHFLEKAELKGRYNGKAGLLYHVSEPGIIYGTNPGGPEVWDHSGRLFDGKGMIMADTLLADNLPVLE